MLWNEYEIVNYKYIHKCDYDSIAKYITPLYINNSNNLKDISTIPKAILPELNTHIKRIHKSTKDIAEALDKTYDLLKVKIKTDKAIATKYKLIDNSTLTCLEYINY